MILETLFRKLNKKNIKMFLTSVNSNKTSEQMED